MGRRGSIALGHQLGLFGEEYERAARMLPILGQQKDIQYHATWAKTVLQDSTVPGMGWGVNPYVGCAFGCAYCYARYAHRYVMERAADGDRMNEKLVTAAQTMPPWLAF